MTNEKNNEEHGWGNLDAIFTDRAASDIRRGLPVLIYDGDDAAFIVACDGLTKHSLANMRRQYEGYSDIELGILISDKRAGTLKIPTKGKRAILIGHDASWTSDGIRAIADPTLDLSYPLKGPFQQTNRPDTPLEQAVIQLLKIAGLLPAAICLIGSKETLLKQINPQEILYINANIIENYNQDKLGEMEELVRTKVPLELANNATIVSFRPRSGGVENLAIIIGNPDTSKPVLTRLHSECFTGDLLGSLKCDCGSQLKGAIDEIEKSGGGVLLYLAQEGRGVGLSAKLKAYALQEQGYDTVDANLRLGFEVDERLYAPAVKILKMLGITAVLLMTNNPKKVKAMKNLGINVVERVSHQFPTNKHNEEYIKTKRDRTGHMID